MELLMEVIRINGKPFITTPLPSSTSFPWSEPALLADPSYLEKVAQVSRMFQDYLDANPKLPGPG
ncbi:MAG: hypothetical protein IPI91_19400 [Flavobacteriales bacterium]|nr:hypothetical protein [Flavobacteriales bacterium]